MATTVIEIAAESLVVGLNNIGSGITWSATAAQAMVRAIEFHQ